jgi:hypothetical protein
MNAKTTPKQYTVAEARSIGDKLGMDWEVFTVKQYQTGLNAELADGAYSPLTGFPSDDPILVGKIVRAHLLEDPDYYTRWAQMERTAARMIAREQPHAKGPSAE